MDPNFETPSKAAPDVERRFQPEPEKQDEQFDLLCHLFNPKTEVRGLVEIHDIAGGLVHGSQEGRLRDVDFLFHILRAFEDPLGNITVDPLRDMESVLTCLRIKDIEFLQRRITGLEEGMERGTIDADLHFELFFYQEVKDMLLNWKDDNLSALQAERLNSPLLTFPLLSLKPVVYMLNMNGEDYLRGENEFLPNIRARLQEHGIGNEVIPFSDALESNVMRDVFRNALAVGKKASNKINFFTAGPDEVKCWQIRQRTKAHEAAGVVHPDLEKGFVWAEVMKFEDLKELGSVSSVKAFGKYRWEGKSYVVQEDDIIFFKADRPSSLIKIGIVGLPSVGKSTLFNALTHKSVPTSPPQFAASLSTTEQKEHLICLKDGRFDRLCQLFEPNEQSPARLEIHDVAALVPLLQLGVLDDNLSHIRDADVIFYVLRYPSGAFGNNLVADMDNICAHLRHKDINITKGKLDELAMQIITSKDKNTQLLLRSERIYLRNVYRYLTNGGLGFLLLQNPFISATHEKILCDLQLLTAKPVVCLVNMNEEEYVGMNENVFLNVLNAEELRRRGVQVMIPLCFLLEKRLANMCKDESDKYCKERNIERTCLEEAAYSAANVIHIYTAGPDNVTCWQIRQHTFAAEAARVVHPGYDETGFICPMVMKFTDLENRNVSAEEVLGMFREESWSYVVQDGDIISFDTVDVEVLALDAKISFRHSKNSSLIAKFMVLTKNLGLVVGRASSTKSNGKVVQEVEVKMTGKVFSESELKKTLVAGLLN